MPTPFESAQLNVQLFDLRRDPVLREARAWFLLDFSHSKGSAALPDRPYHVRDSEVTWRSRSILGRFWPLAHL